MSHKPLFDVQEAFRAIVLEHGVPKLANLMGMPVGSLYNKANSNETNKQKPTLADALLVQVLTKDHRIVEAMAATLGGVFIRLPIDETVSDEALLDVMLELGAKSGEFHQEIKDALEDGRIKPDEHQRIAKRGWSYIRAVRECVSRIEGMVDDK